MNALRPNPPARLMTARPLPASTAVSAVRPAGDSDSEGKYELCEDDREWVARTVSRLGPLTDRQRDTLARLLRTRR